MERHADLINRKLNGPGLQETLGILIEADSTGEGSKDVSYLMLRMKEYKGRWCG